jgi:hypothetical protein
MACRARPGTAENAGDRLPGSRVPGRYWDVGKAPPELSTRAASVFYKFTP